MSESPEAANAAQSQVPISGVVETPAPVVKKSRKKRNLFLLTLAFLIAALAFLFLWLFVWRYEETTDDAYVNGNLVQVTPQITGTVTSIAVQDTDTVKAGQTLVTLDDADAQLAFDRAKNELVSAVRQNKVQKSSVQQASAQVYAQKVALANAQADLARRLKLAGTDAVSAEEISHARAAVASAQAALAAAQAQENSSQSALGTNVALEEQPAVQTATSHIKDAWLNLQRTHINSPVAGQVARRSVQLGQKIAPGAPLMTIVPLHELWVDANFKESQLKTLRLGQPVTLESDVYGSKVVYHGKIVGMSAGTGSAFSVLPAQNATGNWIKVVQRVPVRIALDDNDVQKYPLRIGLSMNVKVDTHDNGGAPVASGQSQTRPAQTQVTPDLKGADEAIAQILHGQTK